VDEAVELLRQFGDDAKILAGGQSLGPLLNMRLARPAVVVDINLIPSLDGIDVNGESVILGALVRQRAAERSPVLAQALPLLAEALPWIGHPTIRNRGTVAGSLCHADPAAELPAMAVALGAQMVVRSSRGPRTIAAADFFTGALSNALAPDEMVCETRWPRQKPGAGSAWVELALRHGDYAIVGIAAVVELDGQGGCRAVELVAAGAGDRPVRLAGVAEALVGGRLTTDRMAQACEAARTVTPASDLMASADYKRRVLKVLAMRALQAAFSRATPEAA
jgi:CO/xanthine dehydrogenase FAD-binding subunit